MRDPRNWPFWQIPRRLLVAVLTVEVTAVLLVARLALDGFPGPAAIWRAAAIVGLGVAQAEIAAGIERVRKQLGGPLHVDLCSVWTFAGALVLPPALAVGVAVVVHTHLWWRSWRPRLPLYKQLFSTSTVALACLAAGAVGAVARPGGGLLGELGVVTIVLALLAYVVVNSALVAAAIMMSAPEPDVAAAVGEWDDNALEFATLCLGALTAVGLVVNPYLALFALPAVLLLHRAVLARHLERAAITDHKTGLLTAAAWHTRAERVLARPAAAPSAVLVIDLDHFKRSTTGTGTSQVTACSSRWPRGCARRCASRTSSAASAVRSSSCCSRASTSPTRPLRRCRRLERAGDRRADAGGRRRAAGRDPHAGRPAARSRG